LNNYRRIASSVFLSLCCALILSACALRPADVSENPILQTQSLSSLQQWQINGKLAIISAKERKSASLNWRQQAQNINLILTTVVGSTIANLDYDGELATLHADDKTWQAPSASDLILQVTGWQVPVEELSDWMKGEVDAALVNARFENGLVQSFTTQCNGCLPWTIQYNSYGEFEFEQGSFTLPTSMRLRQEATDTLLILRIDKWK
jgi:outer membrane lipoprotein LolB